MAQSPDTATDTAVMNDIEVTAVLLLFAVYGDKSNSVLYEQRR